VVEFQGQLIETDDLHKFESQNGLPTQDIRTCTGGCTGDAGDESSLDVQFIIAAGTGIPTDYHYSDKFDVVAWASWMQATPGIALVWSVSYGEGINGGIGGHIKTAYAQGLNAQFEKLALLGVSVFIASGDSGVYDRLPWAGWIGDFHPSFPACLPAVTAVGATQLEHDGSEDTGVSWSGGGFSPSEYFSQANATYQNTAVAAYLASGVALPDKQKWDRNGRGIPDVAAVGVDFQVVTNGFTGGVDGTSASCPSVAGIFALLNDARMGASKPPLGFVNPFIYQNMDAFNDITKGKNNGGGLKSLLAGFEATKGWDPVTGVGTPNFPKLLAAAMAI